MKKELDSSNIPWWQPGIILLLKTSRWIFLPLLIAYFLGKWLDRKLSTSPWLFIVALSISFIISIFGLVYESHREVRRIEEEDRQNKLKNNQSSHGSK